MEYSQPVREARQKLQALIEAEAPFAEVAHALDALDTVASSLQHPTERHVGVAERVLAYQIYNRPEAEFLPVFERHLALIPAAYDRAVSLMGAADTYATLRPRALAAIEDLEAVAEPDPPTRVVLDLACKFRKRHGP